jgi:hypothetical protein
MDPSEKYLKEIWPLFSKKKMGDWNIEIGAKHLFNEI